MDIARLLKDLRRQERWEQDDLAKRLGTSQQTVSNWENGTLPRAGALRKLNDLLVELKLPPVSIATIACSRTLGGDLSFRSSTWGWGTSV